MLDNMTGPRRGAGFLGFSILFLLSLPLRAGAYEGDPLTNAVRDLGYIQDAPARLNERPEALLAGGLLAAGAVIYASDEGIRHFFRVNRTSFLDHASDDAEKIGNGGYPHVAFLGICGGAGVVFRDRKLKDTTLEAAEAFLAANAVGGVVKYAAGRSRPYLENGKRSFRPFSFKASRSSFPSGHATSAFAIASVFASRYRSFWVRGVM
ncbi:MAG TPA: phosphatase PAP2 family protein, partial [Elusimicrobiales bacterium]|nr:phosphatase PAP2 family protein [Elusimicrobiales bacterium]